MTDDVAAASDRRQRLLILCLASADVASQTVAWSLYDGASEADPMVGQGGDDPPYPSVLAAMRDGWRVIQCPVLFPPDRQDPYAASNLKFEYILEQLT